MFWKRLSLTKKIFLALALTSTTIVVLMALMVGLSMRTGFARYVVQAEINRFDSLEQYLVKTALSENPRWPELAASPGAWNEVLRRHMRPHRPPKRKIPRSLEANASEELPPPRRKHRPKGGILDPLGLAKRVSLFDDHGNLIVGTAKWSRESVRRPIMPVDGSSESQPLGWIGLSAPLGAPGPADALFMETQLWSLAFASMTALALSALAALFLARQFLAPVKALADGANALAAGNYANRMQHDRRDELGTLIDHYNGLAQSLEAAENAERQWISDTSHELQTPLAILRAEIEALQDNVRQPSPDVLKGLHASVMRLSHLVGDLNTLSRTREGGFSLAFAETDLKEIIDESIDHASPGIVQAGLVLRVNLDETLPTKCDRYRVYQLLGNLLENARRYTVAPGEIAITATQDDTSVSITVEDTAPCPSEDAIERLFERFYRAEASRSRAHGGSGLGLSICLAIVEAHGGTIRTEASAMGGLKVHFTLPKDSGGTNKRMDE